MQNNPAFEEKEINKRISRDPTILMSCYAQHISYYRQKCFFEIYDPFKRDQLDKKLHNLLLNRMVMLSYNVEKSASLPYNTLYPFLKWIKFKLIIIRLVFLILIQLIFKLIHYSQRTLIGKLL